MAGAGCEVNGGALVLERRHTLRHCERSEAIQRAIHGDSLDCLATSQ